MEDQMKEICPDYDGAEYEVDAEELAFVAASDEVALNSVTYVQDVGMNVRVVTVPGSSPEAFQHVTSQFGVCDCSPPSVWLFTGVSRQGTVHIVHTLSVHDAVHLLRPPDHLFEENGGVQGTATMPNKLTMVPATEGLSMVLRETQDHLAGMGVPGLAEEDGMTYEQVASTDVDEMIAKFLADRDD